MAKRDGRAATKVAACVAECDGVQAFTQELDALTLTPPEGGPWPCNESNSS